MNFRRGLFGWLLFVAVATLLFLWLKADTPKTTVTAVTVVPRTLNPLADTLLTSIPWLLILCFIVFFVIRLRGRYRKYWDKTPEFQQPHVAEFDDQGVRISSALNETLYRWPSFVEWAETKNLVLLLMPNTNRVMIPKRAAGSETGLQQLRDFLKSHVRQPTGGFPVVAPDSQPPFATRVVESQSNTNSP